MQMQSLKDIASYMFEKCAQAKLNDKILIITDTNKIDIAKHFHQAALDYHKESVIIIINPAMLDGEEPPESVFNAMQNVDIILEITTWSLTHTKASKNAMKNGVKIISMPAITEEVLLNYIDVDYDEMKEIADNISESLTKGTKINIKTELGTDLIIDIENKKGYSMPGICEAGKFINLPDGEALISPKNANGVLVIDGSMPPDTMTKWGMIGKIINPIEVYIKEGKIIGIIGKHEAQIFKNILEDYGESSKIIAELGIGVNKKAKIIGNITVDEKALGTIHIAFGNSAGIGGINYVPIHLDCVIKSPTIYIDDKLFMDKGKIIV